MGICHHLEIGTKNQNFLENLESAQLNWLDSWKRIFWDCCRNIGHFICGVEGVKRYVNFHLHCTISNLKWTNKMSTFPARGKISADAHACVVCVYNLTSALYFVTKNIFCVIPVPFVATSRLACRWMCDSPRMEYVRRLCYTHIYMWREELFIEFLCLSKPYSCQANWQRIILLNKLLLFAIALPCLPKKRH